MSEAAEIVRRPLPERLPEWPEPIHPLLLRLFAARGVGSPAEADFRLRALAPPRELGGLDAACALLASAIAQDERILVIGDYDADGATATAVMVRGLRLLGAREVAFRVPNRFVHGYGLGAALVGELAEPLPALLVTVDNGIASHEGVAAARARGIRVLVTDHHLPGPTLPDADAIVDPNLPGDAFPSKALAGVGVAFYLLVALRAAMRATQMLPPGPEPDLSVLLDLVALGTVADLVPLDANNRVLVAAGLRRMRARACCAGITALAAVAGRELARITTSDLGFAIAPRLNAAGRLEDMSIGIECLLCDDPARAHELAATLHAINAQRREVQQGMVDEAERLAASVVPAGVARPRALVLFERDWHPGVVGLVASRIKDRWNCPVLAFAPAGEGSDELRGSGRSVPGFHLRDALADVAARHPGLIARFGGHAMAAGLSIDVSRLDALREAFTRRAAELLGEHGPAQHWSDGALDAREASLELAELLANAAPWGQGFPEPAFDGVFAVESWRILGERHLGLRLRYAACGTAIDAVHFGGYSGSAPPARIHALYQLAVDDWRGERRLRLLLRHVSAA